MGVRAHFAWFNTAEERMIFTRVLGNNRPFYLWRAVIYDLVVNLLVGASLASILYGVWRALCFVLRIERYRQPLKPGTDRSS